MNGGMQDIVVLDDAVPTDQVEEKEDRIISGQPTAVIIHPTSGKKYPIYPKAQGYFYKIQEASNEYLIALATYETRSRRTWIGKFWKGWWRFRRRMQVDRIERAKFNLLTLILEDMYNPSRHCELTRDEFASMPHDTVVEMLAAYQDANNIDDILSKLIPDWAQKKTTEEVQLVKEARGLRQ